MLENFGKGVFRKIKNQHTESEKDEREFLRKIFSRGRGHKQINQKQCNQNFFGYIFLKDVGSKDVQQRKKHFRDQESIV